MMRHAFAVAVFCGIVGPLAADPPVATYIFPAGGQRGQTVDVRVGGLNLHDSCGFEMLGRGVDVSPTLKRTKTIWFEGPVLPLPDSQQQEDYPKDHSGKVTIAADAALGLRHWRLWTDQGASPAKKFVVGELPEIIEQEIDGEPVPVEVKVPVTINGRIFPREDVDVWSFTAKKGVAYTCEVNALRLGSLLEARLALHDPHGRLLVEKIADGSDPILHFTAPDNGKYAVHIHDVSFKGGQAYVYRLTISDGPFVERVYPLGGRRGTTTLFTLSGQGLPAEPVAIKLPADAPDDFAYRHVTGARPANEVLLDLDDLPEYSDPQKEFTAPAVLNGRISKPGAADQWAIKLDKNEAIDFDLRAARLGSPLHGVLTVFDSAGKEMARVDPTGSAVADPFLHFTAPTPGTYRIRVEDRFRQRGGPEYGYRLRVTFSPAPPDFRLTLATDALSLNRGQALKLKVNVERQGSFKDPIALQLEGLPPGVSATMTTLDAGKATVDIELKADAAAKIQVSHVIIRGTAAIGGQTVSRTALLRGGRGVPDVDNVLLAVALPTPFKIVGTFDMRLASRGTLMRRKYRIERTGYDGPIEVRLADHQARHLQGVTGTTLIVPAGATEFDYGILLPPWLEMGRTSRTCVMGIAHIKDANGDHIVSFTSIQINEQFIAVIEPSPLGVELERASITSQAGGAVNLVVTVSRSKDFEGPVRVELIVPEHMAFLKANPVEVMAGQTKGTLTLRFPTHADGPYNMPVVVRATLIHKGDPVVGEAKLEIQPPVR